MLKYFVQKIDVPGTPREPSPDGEACPNGEVLESKEITEEHYETIEKNRDAVERGFDGRWHEAFITLIRAIEAIRNDYLQDAKETMDRDVELKLLSWKLVVERILLKAKQIKENTEGA